MDKSVVIIPTYNEIDNIESLIEKISALNLALDILIIDDDSPDGTGKLLNSLGKKFSNLEVVHRSKKSGLGTAYREGFAKALEKGYEYIICMDGDLSHDPQYLSLFLDKILGCDLVLGSRFLNGMHIINWSLSRLILSLSAIQYVKMVTGLPFSDPLSGYKCFKRRTLLGIIDDNIISKGYLFQAETVYRAYKKGYRIEEIPISFVNRRIGKSKLSLGVIVEGLFKIFRFKACSYRK